MTGNTIIGIQICANAATTPVSVYNNDRGALTRASFASVVLTTPSLPRITIQANVLTTELVNSGNMTRAMIKSLPATRDLRVGPRDGIAEHEAHDGRLQAEPDRVRQHPQVEGIEEKLCVLIETQLSAFEVRIEADERHDPERRNEEQQEEKSEGQCQLPLVP